MSAAEQPGGYASGSYAAAGISAASLSLEDLERFDSFAPARSGRERRFCCPLLNCSGKRLDRSHRSLSVDMESGAWFCHRCGETGKLLEHRNREQRDYRTLAPRERSREELRKRLAVPEPAPFREPDTIWREKLIGAQLLAGSPAEAYLAGRGISAETAARSGVLFHPSFYGRPAALFPLRGEGTPRPLVGANGRYLDGNSDPKTRTAGNLALGVFWTPGAVSSLPGGEPGRVILVEGPADALSLAMCGYPALALVGCSWPEWLPRLLAWRRVLVATDADDGGDRAAFSLAPALRAVGARPERLRPEGAKDWNELLTARGEAELRAALERVIGSPENRGREQNQ